MFFPNISLTFLGSILIKKIPLYIKYLQLIQGIRHR